MNKPLIYYGLSVFIGCLSSFIFINNIFIGAVLSASFLAAIIFTKEKIFSTVIAMFLILGMASFYNYYNLIDLHGKPVNIRLIQKKSFNSIGVCQGRKLYLFGDLKNIEEGDTFLAQGGFIREGDYSKGVVGNFTITKLIEVKKDFLSSLYSVKRSVYEEFNSSLGKDGAALIMSLCFGETRYLSLEQKNDLQKLGVVHAISVSGFHMALIFVILERYLGFKLTVITSVLYIFLTGAQPATLRAFIMLLILKLGRNFLRNYDALSALSFSAMILLIFKPYFAVDLGFQLSYLASLGIVLYYKKLLRSLYMLPHYLNEPISVMISAQVFSMPCAALTFGNFSIGFFLGNLLLLPMYSAIVVVGNVALLFIKFKSVFYALTFCLKYMALSVETATEILSKVSPPIMKLTYIDSFTLIVVIICFMLVKHGYEKYKFLPLFLLPVILFQNYYFFLDITYLNSSKGDTISVRYKSDEILFSKSGLTAKGGDGNEPVTYISHSAIRLNNEYVIIPKKIDSDEGHISIEVQSLKKKLLFTKDVNNFVDLDLKSYDIIKIPKDNKKLSSEYIIILGKVYSLE